MTARTRLNSAEFAELQRRRQASAEAAARGRAHRALPLAEVEARQRVQRKPWPNLCPTCNVGCHGECDCAPAPGCDAPEFLADPPRPAPPAYPWRALGAGLLVLMLTLACVHVIATATKPQQQVAKR